MYSKEIILQCDGGLHARPASDFVACAKSFSSSVKIRNLSCPERPAANAKSIMRVLAEGIESGSRIEIIAEGEDETQAVETLSAMVERHFQEG